MNAEERAYAYFRVASEHLPLEEITATLDIAPTEVWKKGDPGKYNPSRPDSGWCLYSPLPRSNLRLDEHVEAVLDLLAAKEKEIYELSIRFSTYLVCVGHFCDSSPGFFLSKETLQSVAQMGLSLDCDLYCDCGEQRDT